MREMFVIVKRKGGVRKINDVEGTEGIGQA